MTEDDAVVGRWFIRVVRGLAYALFGSVFISWFLGPDLFGYNGTFAADAARVLFPFLLIVWFLLFPFFLLVGYSIEVVFVFLGLDERKIKLR